MSYIRLGRFTEIALVSFGLCHLMVMIQRIDTQGPGMTQMNGKNAYSTWKRHSVYIIVYTAVYTLVAITQKCGENPWRGVMKAVLEDKRGNLRALDYITVAKLFKSCALNSLKIWVSACF